MKKSKLHQLITNSLMSGLVFVLPSNLFFVLTRQGSYVNGISVDYLLPKFYLSDLLLIVLSLWLWFMGTIKLKPVFSFFRANKLLLTLGILVIFRQFFATAPFGAIWQTVKLLEIAWFCFLLGQIWSKINKSWLISSVSLALFFQSGLGLLQFFNQKSIAGYWLFGEPNLNNQIGLAKQVLLGQNLTLPYGTTAHPNVLAGFISVALLAFFICWRPRLLNKYQAVVLTASIATGIVCLWFTQSWSAMVTLIWGIIFLKIFKAKLWSKLWLVIFFTSIPVTLILGQQAQQTSLYRRGYLLEAGLKMFLAKPIFGQGINNFVYHVEAFSPTREVVRFVQPAHHVPILFLAEWGILGLLFLFLIWQKADHDNKAAFLKTVTILLPILVLDHYLYTLQTGLLLTVFLFALIKNSSVQHQK